MTYEFQEYPKWISTPHGDHIAENAEHEAELLGEPHTIIDAASVDEPEAANDGLPDDRQELFKLADERGITVNKMWSTAKIKEVIGK